MNTNGITKEELSLLLSNNEQSKENEIAKSSEHFIPRSKRQRKKKKW